MAGRNFSKELTERRAERTALADKIHDWVDLMERWKEITFIAEILDAKDEAQELAEREEEPV